MGALKDLTGQRYGRLTVLERAGSGKQKRATWRCICDCGNETVAVSTYLIRGDTRSCGCSKIDMLVERSTKHGKGRTRLYHVWGNMVQRCTDQNHDKYKYYGGRGITVCDEWRNDFQAFYDWAMANGYDEAAPRGKCTIDRIDNDKGYCPENCRWVNMKVQNNNKNRKVHNDERN